MLLRRVVTRRFSVLSRAVFGAAVGLALIGSAVTPSYAAGAFAIGKCGAYGKAIDYAGVTEAKAAARKNCSGDCTTVTMKRACAALSVDMTNPCGAHGYAVESRISTSLNAAVRKCYEFGGKECVIRAWACDARG
ncbi:MAG: DUF4189 domain-containing protein [Xanthobacteraceae bacterium]